MNKLADIEKKFNEEKYFKEDQNRPFVIKNSNQFLQNVSVQADKVVEERILNESSIFEIKKQKPTNVFILDKGPN